MIPANKLERTDIDGDAQFDMVRGVLDSVCRLLPHENGYRIWASGDEILCETEQLAENIADLFDAMLGYPDMKTGYYDPEEDARNNEVDDHTGYYYATLAE